MAFLMTAFGFLGRLWRAVWGFLIRVVPIPLGIVLGAFVLGLLLGAGHGNARYKTGFDKGVESVNKAQRKIAQKIERRQDRITTRAEAQATKTEARIEYRYRTLREKVRIYVPKVAPPGVIRCDDRLPVGAVSLLDAAARGDDPDAVSVTSGQSYETGSPVRFCQLVDNYVVNLGIGHTTAAQLTGLQGWIREQEAASP